LSEFAPYVSIAASAGSGKTFQLAHRVLRLIAMNQDPDRIGAYTFSRKAAGEIFDSIVNYLRLAATNEEMAARTSEHIGQSRSAPEFEQDLRSLFQHLHRLRIGTLDSRISQMVSAASVELGLPPEFSVMDSASSEYQRLQNRVLNALFQGTQLRSEDSDTFLQLFSEATHGQAEKDFTRHMIQFLADYRMTFLTHPHPDAWKGPEINDPPLSLDEEARTRLANNLLPALDGVISNKSIQTALVKIITACREYTPGSTWSNDAPSGKIWEQFIANPQPSFTYRNKEYTLPSEIWTPLHRLIRHPIGLELEDTRRKTRAIYGFLLTYDYAYRNQILPRGTLAFEDACTLMSDFSLVEPKDMAYRLDGEIDHWLLDEFQDTNLLQWNVLKPFLSEVLQDPEKRRSFFYVGDVKQAIYAWRGGDSTLFYRIRDQWPDIADISIDQSYRSAQPVLDLVNQIFTRIDPGDSLNPDAVERWNHIFSPHTSTRTAFPGHARVLQSTDNEAEMSDIVLDLVREIPNGREIAILTRTNTEGGIYANALREAGLPVSLEGAAKVRDDTAVEAVLAALKLAAHPGDAFSRQLTRLAGLDIHPFSLLCDITEYGITAPLRNLISQLILNDTPAFSKNRLKRLTQLALEFDTLGEPSVDRFLSFVDQAHLKENEAKGVIRIMTIHQSKGLGFDAVIVPVKSSSSLCKITPGQAVVAPQEDESSVISILPTKEVCEYIPEYRQLYHDIEAQSTYENLCTLYVALTRAKQSLQIVLPAPPKTSTSNYRNTGNFLQNCLPIGSSEPQSFSESTNILYETGDPTWFTQQIPEPEVRQALLPFGIPQGPPVIPRLEPSQADHSPTSIGKMFTFIPHDGRELGTRVHEALSQLDWTDNISAEDFLTSIDEDPDSEAAVHIRNAFTFQELKSQEGVVEVWKEQKFETILPNGWVTGIFDRVVIFKNAAWIQDYKTNRHTGPDTVAHYAPQMELYRTVLADMLSLDPESIHCQLLFTHTGEIADI
jgi:ATP-dependent exoDNAse (exonuclease V) beta subunit